MPISQQQPSYFQQVINQIRTGPKFGWEIDVDYRKKDMNVLYRRRRVSRSSRAYPVRGPQSYAYALPEFDGKTLKWEYEGRKYEDVFHLCPLGRAEQRNNGIRGKVQGDVEVVLRESGALFPTEIHRELLKKGYSYNRRNVWKAIARMKRDGRLTSFDDRHGGWRFMYRGTLVALAEDDRAFTRRMDTVDEALMSPTERSIMTKLRGAIYTAKELRMEVGVEDSLLSYIIKKFGKEAPYEAKSVGTGKDYHIEVGEVKDEHKLQGRGLVSWVRYLNLFGLMLVWDDEKVPEHEVVSTIKKLGYWASDEGRRRKQIGDAWEDYVERWFKTVTEHNEWQLRILEERKKWRGQTLREFDRIFRVGFGPPELAISLYFIFEMKAGFISASDVDIFYSKVINEPEFRNYATGGAKNNAIMIMVGAKTAEPNAFRKAAQMGMKIILHTSVEDVVERLTGDDTSFYKIARAIPNAAKGTEARQGRDQGSEGQIASGVSDSHVPSEVPVPAEESKTKRG